MFTTRPGADRRKLGFKEAVLSAFDFLTLEYEFRVTQTEPTFVRYESDRVFVNVYHGRTSYELGVKIGRLSDLPGREYSIEDLLDALGKREESGYAYASVRTPQLIVRFVPRLSAVIKEYASSALRGDSATFEQLAAVQQTKGDALTKEWELQDARQEAETAWRQKDYAKLVQVLGSIEEDLTPAEAKKLQYAKKHQ
ncbi:MAG: hypothetical protein ACRD9S_18695 [Pyrinomonadaceae bacterium]